MSELAESLLALLKELEATSPAEVRVMSSIQLQIFTSVRQHLRHHCKDLLEHVPQRRRAAWQQRLWGGLDGESESLLLAQQSS